MKHLSTIIYIAWLVWGIAQFAAMVSGLGIFLSLLLGGLPVIGTVFAIKGAVTNWHWDILPSIIFFIAPYLVIGGLYLFEGKGKNSNEHN
jgi:hypothetical protein